MCNLNDYLCRQLKGGGMEIKMDGKKKIGLIGCIAAGIGAIIGSGIFGSLPEVINSIGSGVIAALIAATVYIIACIYRKSVV